MWTRSRGWSGFSRRSARTLAEPQLPLPRAVKGAPTHQGGCPLRQRSNTISFALALAAAVSLLVAAVAMAASIVGPTRKDNPGGAPPHDTINAPAGHQPRPALWGKDNRHPRPRR